MINLKNFSLFRRFYFRDFIAAVYTKSNTYKGLTLRWGSDGTYDRNVVTVEDGFIRSRGLGVHLHKPCSLVFDSKGIYFDPRYESDLENLLNDASISQNLVLRSEKLIKSIILNDISKYNLDSSLPSVGLPKKQRTILIPGQVEGDASIRFGSPNIRSNLELVQKVREENPTAYLVYKPHPDVVAEQREGGDCKLISQLADVIVNDCCISELINDVDEVHTLTSLTGFEALLRNKRVATYGLPFYAGWGLTTDYIDSPRRQRMRSLAELVACTLILYPKYWHPEQNRLCEAEDIISYLASRNNFPLKMSIVQRLSIFARKLKNAIK